MPHLLVPLTPLTRRVVVLPEAEPMAASPVAPPFPPAPPPAVSPPPPPATSAPVNGTAGSATALATVAEPAPAAPPVAEPAGPLAHWVRAIDHAHDACLLVDPDGEIVAVSPPGRALLGVAPDVEGEQLLDVIELLDFETGQAHPEYAPRIPPLSVVHSEGLLRGLLRVRHDNGRVLTLDAVSAPLRDGEGQVVASFTFLASITPDWR